MCVLLDLWLPRREIIQSGADHLSELTCSCLQYHPKDPHPHFFRGGTLVSTSCSLIFWSISVLCYPLSLLSSLPPAILVSFSIPVYLWEAIIPPVRPVYSMLQIPSPLCLSILSTHLIGSNFGFVPGYILFCIATTLGRL